SEHIREYQRHLLAKARSDSHITETVRLLNSVMLECRLHVLADLQRAGDKLTDHLATRREEGSSHRTVNADLIAVRSFCRWLLAKKRLHMDPTAGLERLNVEEDRRLERRPLTDVEAQKLIEAAYSSAKVIRGLTGPDRAMLYWLAQRTGLRRGELRSLYPASFDLVANPASVRVNAKHSKRRRNDMLPLSPDVAAAFQGYLNDRDPKSPVWPGGWWRRSAEMLREDLAAAGIAAVDADGRVLDFHGQRTTFITGLARAGVSPATAQKLARHSDINLTLGTYTRLGVADLSTAVDSLPRLSPHPSQGSQPEAAANTPASSNLQLQQLIHAWQHIPGHIRDSIIALLDSVPPVHDAAQVATDDRD
ncbi:MAG: site-specific integrase, partial [Planctomycetota bacterium]|nr:site-specific integrase [Planctomycetota bacterium]